MTGFRRRGQAFKDSGVFLGQLPQIWRRAAQKFRRLGLLVGAEGEAGGADVVPAMPGVNGSMPLAG